MKRWLFFACLVGLSLLSSSAAHAAAPRQQGWWTRANPGVEGSGVAAAPDVPEDGLLVQGGVGGPVAYAALVYDLPAGTAAERLTLKIAPQSVSTEDSTLAVCPLTDASIRAVQGGPMADAPAYDCSTQLAAAPVNGLYTFELTTLSTGGALAVAIVPTGSSDRVAFDEPDADSLAVTTAAQSDGQSPGSPLAGGVAPSMPLSTGLPAYPDTAPVSIAPPASATPARPSPGSPAESVGFGPAGSSDVDADPVAVVGALALSILGAGLWFAARRAAVRGAMELS